MFRITPSTLFLWVTVVSTGLTACVTGRVGPPAEDDLRSRFLRSIEDAAVPEPSEVTDDLLIITDDNPALVWQDPNKKEKLLVVAIMNRDAQQRFYSEETGSLPKDRPILWVTLAPQVQTFCKELWQQGDSLELRIKQYLGLDPNREYDTVVTLWIERGDLFRPCTNPRTDRAACDTELVEDPKVPRLDDYAAFFNGLYPSSYWAKGAPWTRLGYTYDWGNPDSEVGATELMAAPGTLWEREGVMGLSDYCRP